MGAAVEVSSGELVESPLAGSGVPAAGVNMAPVAMTGNVCVTNRGGEAVAGVWVGEAHAAMSTASIVKASQRVQGIFVSMVLS
jgi:hypothetical protein